MKTLPFILLFSVLTLASSYVSGILSPGGCVRRLEVQRQEKDVAVAWEATGAAKEFVVERSYDGEYFEAVKTLGRTQVARQRYTDRNVYPGIIYYRIKAIKENGGVENSAVETLRLAR